MRLILVRHGDPDYKKDCLTPLGRRQAAAVAKRLTREGIGAIYASSNGRAQETAAYAAKRLRLPVQTLDFMHEIAWRKPDLPEKGHPWKLACRLLSEEGYDFFREDWRQHPYFQDAAATRSFDAITPRFDALLAEWGYRHEGRHFFCSGDTDRTIALFSHGGSGGCVLAHLLGLPYPYAFAVMPYGHTSVTLLEFPNRPGEYVYPRLVLFNDTAHLRSLRGPFALPQRSPLP